ncbi:glycosyltransferase [Enterococcus sp. AZ109]|uniref:glycosyltransferase n=1 Tax=Enterococcus sp. AZ109 TaxID=2774634 RepID=UPI003F2989B7
MATFNGEKVIVPQLESIMRQTLQPDEVLIFDDCSSDGTFRMISEFIRKNQLESRWKIKCNQKNLGYCNNFRNAVAQATGDIIFFADQDDIWRGEKIELMTKMMAMNPEIELLAAEFIPFQGEPPQESLQEKKSVEEYQIEKINFTQRNMYLRSVGCTMAIQHSFVDKILPFWYDQWAQDEIVWKLSMCEGTGYTVNYPSIFRRFHENNTSGKKMHTVEKRMEYLINLDKSFKYMIRFIETSPYADKNTALIQINQAMVKHRQEVVQNGNLRSALLLLFKGLSTYHKKRGWLVELYLGLQKN